MKKIMIALAASVCLLNLPIFAEEDAYHQYQPKTTSHQPEDIEWSIDYSYHTPDNESPRLLLIGDSIVNGYQSAVQSKLGDRMNLTYWASSRCVTAPDYFIRLSIILSLNRYSVISFNNGLHSLGTDLTEWEAAYRNAVKFIRTQCPEAKLYLTLSTPLKDPELTKKSQQLNDIVRQVAQDENLPVIDLFSVMDPLDRDEYWSDTYHFQPAGIDLEAETIVQTILNGN